MLPFPHQFPSRGCVFLNLSLFLVGLYRAAVALQICLHTLCSVPFPMNCNWKPIKTYKKNIQAHIQWLHGNVKRKFSAPKKSSRTAKKEKDRLGWSTWNIFQQCDCCLCAFLKSENVLKAPLNARGSYYGYFFFSLSRAPFFRAETYVSSALSAIQ